MATVNKAVQGSATARRQGLRSVWLAVQTWALRRRERRMLARLDEHLLRDIGLSRASAKQECAKPFWAE